MEPCGVLLLPIKCEFHIHYLLRLHDRFAINLGRDRDNLLLHFNPRFDTSDIVCNYKACGVWGQELRESLFPFQQGEEAKISISFDAKAATVTMPGNKVIKFPNQLGLDSVHFFSVAGDFKIKSVKFLNFYAPFAALN
ncbi:16 kDa beta-galactoside-binding lectin-like [Zootoca vivipara]|uniref:16 kDa beta-galactoside-binding lectin-like n=1 Tax=Zootoca vivipara TaxID=8524 RepID=UPI00293BCC18|nr:16 kDa beta-galactoside-binding lectin-like [Zootoca vivipara]